MDWQNEAEINKGPYYKGSEDQVLQSILSQLESGYVLKKKEPPVVFKTTCYYLGEIRRESVHNFKKLKTCGNSKSAKELFAKNLVRTLADYLDAPFLCCFGDEEDFIPEMNSLYNELETDPNRVRGQVLRQISLTKKRIEAIKIRSQVEGEMEAEMKDLNRLDEEFYQRSSLLLKKSEAAKKAVRESVKASINSELQEEAGRVSPPHQQLSDSGIIRSYEEFKRLQDLEAASAPEVVQQPAALQQPGDSPKSATSSELGRVSPLGAFSSGASTREIRLCVPSPPRSPTTTTTTNCD